MQIGYNCTIAQTTEQSIFIMSRSQIIGDCVIVAVKLASIPFIYGLSNANGSVVGGVVDISRESTVYVKVLSLFRLT